MPLLVYPTGDFQPLTKILSADMNGKLNAIKTLLNTTLLDSTNVQQYGLTRDRLAPGTPNYILVNDSGGNISQVQIVPTTAGGSGIAYSPVLADNGKVLQVNGTGSALTFDVTPSPGTLKVLSFYYFP